MENKYYVPDITEFREGFEYELKMDGNWYPMSSPFYPLVNNSGLEYRVKYLNKEDIESFGFNHIGALWFENIEKSYRIRKWKGNEVDIYKWWIDGDNNLIFRGKIKNKSELQQVLKMIGVIGQ